MRAGVIRLRAGGRPRRIKCSIGAGECARNIIRAVAATSRRIFEIVELLPRGAANFAVACGSGESIHTTHTSVAVVIIVSNVVFAFPHAIGAKDVIEIRAFV